MAGAYRPRHLAVDHDLRNRHGTLDAAVLAQDQRAGSSGLFAQVTADAAVDADAAGELHVALHMSLGADQGIDAILWFVAVGKHSGLVIRYSINSVDQSSG